MAYVQKLKPGCKLEVTAEDDGTILVKADRGGSWAKYEFCEE